MHTIVKAAAMSAGLVLLSSCGGGGDSAGPSSHQQTLGGTLTGYLGGGLTLLNNGGTPLQVAKGATTFAFAESVDRGSAYNVTVGADPFGPRQGCTVANGTGTASANVSSVVVTCTTSTFPVGGNVSGLLGSGLTLQLNGGSSLTVPAGAATYAFPSVASGTAWVVTVGTQPSGPAQTCTVANGAGTVGAGNTGNVNVTCVSTGFTLGGAVTGLTGSGLAVRLNGGAPVTIAAGATLYAFPDAVFADLDYRVTISSQPTTPSQSCTLARGNGRVGVASVTNAAIQCVTNTTSPLSGTYSLQLPGAPRNYLTLWPDGTYAFAVRSDDPACGSTNGNGIEYGVYNWNATTHAFAILTAAVDGNGECGVWNAMASPPQSLVGTLVKSGSTLTVTVDGETFSLPAVTSTPGTIIGSFVSSNGNDGMFVVFHADGTYLFAESQLGFRNGVLAGYERGCYTLSGAAITASLSASCRPDGLPALDTNGNAGFSQTLGSPIPIVISGPNAILVGGRSLTRLLTN